jgi:hypothetical protein
VADAKQHETWAQHDHDNARHIRHNSQRNIRHDELALERAQAKTREVQERIDRLDAAANEARARSLALLEKLKDCVSRCRVETRTITGLDAQRIDTYFTFQVRDGGSDEDAHSFSMMHPQIDAPPPPPPAEQRKSGSGKSKALRSTLLKIGVDKANDHGDKGGDKREDKPPPQDDEPPSH